MTTLFIGYRSNQALAILRERMPGKVVFLDLERYPRELPFYLRLSGGALEGCLFPPDEDPVPFDQVSCVYVHEICISSEAGVGFDQQDWAYLSTECWASLIALLEALKLHCRVANSVSSRHEVESRVARLTALSAHGVPIAPMLVTSHPEAARKFYAENRGRVAFRSLSGEGSARDRAMQPADLERLEDLRTAPVAFEGKLGDQPAWLALVGGRAILCPAGAAPPEPGLVQACLATARRLELELCEVVLRRLPNGRYQAVDLIPFLTPGTLAVPEVLEAALNLAWEGVPA